MVTMTLAPDLRAARLAARRHGLVTLAQALQLGLSADQVARRVRSGRWERVGRGVYRITGAPITPQQAALAAVLRASGGALVSHLSAVALLGLAPWPNTPHVTVGTSAGARTPGVLVHRSDVPRGDRTTVGCIPATTPARALIDIAPMVDGQQLGDLVDAVICGGLAQPSQILSALRRSQRRPGRAGTVMMRDVLRPWLTGIRPGSPAEVRLLRRIEAWGLPTPVSQHLVRRPTGEVVAALDLAWPCQQLGLEYDGEQFHTPRRLGADMEREESLRAMGWRIERADRSDLAPGATRLRSILESLLHRQCAA